MEESKNLDQYWTVKLLREALKQYINICENAQRHEYNAKGLTYRGQMKGDGYCQITKPFVERSKNQAVEALLVDSTKNNEKQKNQPCKQPSLPCIFCKDAHFIDNCDKFRTVTERKHELVTQGRCFICLKIGHLSKECLNAHSKFCCYCKRAGQHNRSFMS